VPIYQVKPRIYYACISMPPPKDMVPSYQSKTYSLNPTVSCLVLYCIRILNARTATLTPCPCPCPSTSISDPILYRNRAERNRIKANLSQRNAALLRSSLNHYPLTPNQSITSALLSPSIVIPRNANKMLRFRLWFRLKLSTKSCSATLVMIPAVMPNRHA